MLCFFFVFSAGEISSIALAESFPKTISWAGGMIDPLMKVLLFFS